MNASCSQHVLTDQWGRQSQGPNQNQIESSPGCKSGDELPSSGIQSLKVVRKHSNYFETCQIYAWFIWYISELSNQLDKSLTTMMSKRTPHSAKAKWCAEQQWNVQASKPEHQNPPIVSTNHLCSPHWLEDEGQLPRWEGEMPICLKYLFEIIHRIRSTLSEGYISLPTLPESTEILMTGKNARSSRSSKFESETTNARIMKQTNKLDPQIDNWHHVMQNLKSSSHRI